MFDMIKSHCILGILFSGLIYLTNSPGVPEDTTPDVKKGGPKIPPLPAVSPLPAPTPLPGGAIPLPSGVELLISSDTKFLVVAFPENMVKIKKLDVGAGKEHTLTGTFIDPTDASKVTDADQTFTGPCYLYRIRSAGIDGTCELFIIEIGADTGTRVKVLCGKGPQPPPIVPPVVPPVVPPTPTDALTQSLQLAYNVEPATVADKQGKVWSKADYVQKLAALYSAAANVTVRDTGVKTYGDLFSELHAASLFPTTALPSLRKAVGDYLDVKLKPTTSKPIDRDTCAAEFKIIADALKGVK